MSKGRSLGRAPQRLIAAVLAELVEDREEIPNHVPAGDPLRTAIERKIKKLEFALLAMEEL